MKQVFFTGDLPNRVIVEDGQFTEKDKKILFKEEMSDMTTHPDQLVFFRKYKTRSFLKSVLGFLGLVFVPRKGAKTESSLELFESDIYAPNNPNSKVKWRKYAPLEVLQAASPK